MRLLNWVIPFSLLYGASFAQTNNTLTPDEVTQGYTLLFDGTMKSIRDNFVAYQQNGANVTTLPANIDVPAGKDYMLEAGATQDIRSIKMYDDFDLKFEYRITDNAGLNYRINLLTATMYQNAIEYPIYNGTPVPGDWNAPGAAYDIYAPSVNNYKSFSSGEWNSSRVRMFKDSVYHWHNDVLVVKFSMLSSDYKARVVARKWANVPCIAVEAATLAECDHNNPYRKTGYIGFQTGYPGNFYVRNLKIAKYPFPVVTSVNANSADKIGFSAVPTAQHGMDINVDAREEFQLRVFSPEGKQVQQFHGSANSTRFTYQASAPGLYFIQLASKSGKVIGKTILD